MINNLKLKNESIKELIPSATNARLHSEEQVNQIAASISEFGFNNPVLIDEKKEIIAGHGRILAAEILGLEKAPCITLSHLNAAQKKAYLIADNKLAENSTWDTILLKENISELKDLDFDIALLGFDDSELGQIFDETEKERKEQRTILQAPYSILILCKDEPEMSQLFEEFQERGLQCKLLS